MKSGMPELARSRRPCYHCYGFDRNAFRIPTDQSSPKNKRSSPHFNSQWPGSRLPQKTNNYKFSATDYRSEGFLFTFIANYILLFL
jgi:hypothetical protein